MIVYRLMSKNELDLYLSGNVEDIGRSFRKGKLSNNHEYKIGERYVHMFKRIKDIDYIRFERDHFEYLATFDIPIITLMISHGKGFYKCIENNRIKHKHINEYAINIKRMKPEYFVSYQKIEKFKYDKQMLSILMKDTIVEKSEKDLTI